MNTKKKSTHKKVKAWAVVSNTEIDTFQLKGELVQECLVQVENNDCLCQAELYDSYAIFRTKKEALNYRLTWQKVVPIEITIPSPT